ncbi:hypothetical protein HRED_02231 [Candidatus Haloredivivus sp. G17]|nr:hypothetical protein HRED_02231 [Candidatus Haloredivivus sp. G17]
MFNLGGNDKEKLKENMEEIRDLVNNQSNDEDHAEQASQQKNQDLDQIKDQVENQVQGQNQQPPTPHQDQETQRNLSSPQNQKENSSRRTRESQSQRKRNPQDSSIGLNSGKSDMKDHLESISSEVKKMEDGNRPEGETLFLEVDEFNEVESMVEEMKYLSREMKDLMDNLEDGVEEDRRIEGEAHDVLDEFAERREKIQSSIQ